MIKHSLQLLYNNCKNFIKVLRIINKKKSPIEKEVRKCDWLVVFCLIMMLSVKAMTLFTFAMIHEETKADIDAIATAYEGNDLFKAAISFGKIGIIIETIMLPAFALAFYCFFRKKVLQGKGDLQTLSFIITFAFFALLINMVNDGSILLGKLWR
jgi:hypothetical protein